MASLNRDDAPAGPRPLQLSGVHTSHRPLPPTCRPSLQVVTGLMPYPWRPLPPQCQKVKALAKTPTWRLARGFRVPRASEWS